MKKNILVKVHESYRNVIAICDVSVHGRFLHEGQMQLDLSTEFFNGSPVSSEELESYIKDGAVEDATFYIAGEESVACALSLGLVLSDGVKEIEGVPFALVLL